MTPLFDLRKVRRDCKVGSLVLKKAALCIVATDLINCLEVSVRGAKGPQTESLTVEQRRHSLVVFLKAILLIPCHTLMESM